MILHLVSGSITMVQAIFGPWLGRNSTADDYLKRLKTWEEWDFEKDPDQKWKKLERSIRNDRQMMRTRTLEEVRVAWNAKDGKEYVPRTDEVRVVEADVLKALDKIFLTVYPDDPSNEDRLAFCVHTKRGYKLYALYIEKVVEYLQRYAERAAKGTAPEAYTERQIRLLRAPALTEVYMTRLMEDDEMELPFPTDSMLGRLWECVDDFDLAFREVS